ncbi:MAG: hypothetical protein LBB61_01650, partial [Treponema sp.]|nr:hypothetical protein [Treponema sp.]
MGDAPARLCRRPANRTIRSDLIGVEQESVGNAPARLCRRPAKRAIRSDLGDNSLVQRYGRSDLIGVE